MVKQSPTRLAIPHAGTWYVTVDLQGLRGQARSSVRVIPKAALSPLPEYSPRSLSGLVRPIGLEHSDNTEPVASIPDDYYDVFISHAAEDKEAIVRQLATSLVSLGLKVWYDEFTLRIGDSLRRKIDAGLARSRFGVVVISPAFFTKNWSQYELDGLVTREMPANRSFSHFGTKSPRKKSSITVLPWVTSWLATPRISPLGRLPEKSPASLRRGPSDQNPRLPFKLQVLCESMVAPCP